MQTVAKNETRRQERRAAITLLLEDPYVPDVVNRVLVADILDNRTGTWAPLWEELRERVEWRDALEDGAHPGYDDNGREEDREAVLEDVQADIAALIDRLAADTPPAVMLPRAA